MDCLVFRRFVENCLIVGNSFNLLPLLNVISKTLTDLNYNIMMI